MITDTNTKQGRIGCFSSSVLKLLSRCSCRKTLQNCGSTQSNEKVHKLELILLQDWGIVRLGDWGLGDLLGNWKSGRRGMRGGLKELGQLGDCGIRGDWGIGWALQNRGIGSSGASNNLETIRNENRMRHATRTCTCNNATRTRTRTLPHGWINE